MENINDDWFPSVIPIKEYDTVVDTICKTFQ